MVMMMVVMFVLMRKEIFHGPNGHASCDWFGGETKSRSGGQSSSLTSTNRVVGKDSGVDRIGERRRKSPFGTKNNACGGQQRSGEFFAREWTKLDRCSGMRGSATVRDNNNALQRRKLLGSDDSSRLELRFMDRRKILWQSGM